MIFIYIAAITAANMLVWYFGPWFSPINSFLLIGLDLSLRDRLHDRYGMLVSVAIVCAGGVVSWLLNPAAANIAIASVVAFVVAGIADAGSYHLLRGKQQLTRMNGSNAVGGAVDSLLFPTIAFGAFMPHIVALQFAAKVFGGALWAYVLTRKAS